MGTQQIRNPEQISGLVGDVQGPAGATSGNVAVFYGTSGKVISDGGVSTIGIVSAAVATTLGLAIPKSGWCDGTGTWSYSSADSPTFVISTSIDQTGLIGVGYRIKLVQTSARYFIVTAISSTTITVYGGTDYTLDNAAITSPQFSPIKHPLGFPASPSKWTVTYTRSTSASQASPGAGTYYNLGSDAISMPIGEWNFVISSDFYGTVPSAQNVFLRMAFSTSSSSVSNTRFMVRVVGYAGVNYFGQIVKIVDSVSVAAKTTYYIVYTTETGISAITSDGTVSSTLIKLVCAYL